MQNRADYICSNVKNSNAQELYQKKKKEKAHITVDLILQASGSTKRPENWLEIPQEDPGRQL